MLAIPKDPGGAKPVEVLAVGHLALDAIERFLLEEQDRVGVADGRRQQTFGVGRGRGCHHFKAGDGHPPVLQALRVLCAEAGAAAIGGANHER